MGLGFRAVKTTNLKMFRIKLAFWRAVQLDGDDKSHNVDYCFKADMLREAKCLDIFRASLNNELEVPSFVGLAVGAAFEPRRFYNIDTLVLCEESSRSSSFRWWILDVQSP
jgi:hypothetical protein